MKNPTQKPLTFVLSGAGRGIGLELTKQLVELGHTVHALARQPKKAPKLEVLRASRPERLSVHAVDVTSDEQVAQFAAALGARTPVDVLINNAGVMGETAALETLSLADVAQTLAVNAIGPMRVTRALLPNLLLSTQPKVAHITSLMGSITDNESGGYYGYRMSKAALNMFHRSLSQDYPGLISLALHPGWVKTEMGGPEAPTPAADSARGLLRQILEAGPEARGRFIDFEGEALPW